MMDEAYNNKMLLEIPNLTQNVALARVTVACFAAQIDFTVTDLDELKVAVSEAVTNAVLHAYEGAGRIQIRAHCLDDCVLVEVRDWGKGIEDVAQAKEASFTTVPGRMGLGFMFMESLTDEMHVKSIPGEGTIVTFKKCLSPDRATKREEDAGAGAAL